jgi:hypothetical protein
MGRLLAFYHIYCNPYTPNIVHDQLMKLIFSGCYEALNSIYCFLSGPDPKLLEVVKSIINSFGSKFMILAESVGDTRFERLTLEAIPSMITADDKILYFHSKGVTKAGSPYVAQWRTMLEYYCFTHWKKAVDLLDSHDTVGCNLQENPKLHYSGNFWWATGKYLQSLPKTIGSDYFDPEFWIGLGGPKTYNFFSSNIRHYVFPYPPVNYVDRPT